ncbi:MAG: allantoinase AllB [Gemmatimonadaceae bacterium]
MTLAPATPPDLVVRARRVVTLAGTRPASVHVTGGVITAVAGYDDVPAGARIAEGGDAVLLPGLVDTHVHMNEPGRAEWEGFRTGTRAAAAGGVTTLLDMPLNSVPATTSLRALQAKQAAAASQCSVDVGFLGGVVPGNEGELRALWDGGVFAFKCFLVPSGVEEFPHVTERDLRSAMPVLAELGATLMVHAELPGPIDGAQRTRAGDPRSYVEYLWSRPRAAEHEAIALTLRLCREFGTRIHIVHLASADALPMLRDARADGLPVTVETCPHYLSFAAEEIRYGATAFKCAPPIRERENRERLWRALGERDIDMIASDHSPAPPELKCLESGDFTRAWGGIASLQLGLAAVWTCARERGYDVGDVARWMSTTPARLTGLGGRKGAIAAGRDADLALWNPDAKWTVDPARLHHRHPVTPYAGLTLRGLVRATWLRGTRIFHEGEVAEPASGTLIGRTRV